MHCAATRAKKTVRYYEVQLTVLSRWAGENQIPFQGFGKRHMDRYLAWRVSEGRKSLTVHHDAICAKKFLDWCSKNGILERNPLADYEVRAASRPPKHMPTDDEMRQLLVACHGYLDISKNPAAKYQPPAKRVFHRDRNYALVLGLIDTACRIGEMLSLKVEDVRLPERQALVRESKGKEPRALPISPEWAQAITVWLKVRQRVMSAAEEDEGWLFVSEYGTRLDETMFLRRLKCVLEYAGLTKQITLHSLRRYSLNKLAKHNLLAAQQIAGHKSPTTTLVYTKLDPEFMREMHQEAGVARGVLGLRRESKRRKLV
jgi:integrase/recombinase XerD